MQRQKLPLSCWYEKYQIDIKDIDFEWLWNLQPETSDDKKVNRVHQAYGLDYKFSGTTAKAEKIPNELMYLLDAFSKKYKQQFNMLLINWYTNGKDYIGHHSDDESQLVHASPVITISLGASRIFEIKNKSSTNSRHRFVLNNGDVFVMGGNFQHAYTHSVIKQAKQTEPRISITLRAFY
jgi:alkylated DNA repair dioxygenase AlkB